MIRSAQSNEGGPPFTLKQPNLFALSQAKESPYIRRFPDDRAAAYPNSSRLRLFAAFIAAAA
jgi:hypothetical protein